MQRLRSLLPALCTIMLVVASAPGYAQNIDCRNCHSFNGPAGAKDFSAIYASPATHHSVGMNYPTGFNAQQNFKQPNGHSGGITFFDSNGNGQPDDNEIQMFSDKGAATVECASCHQPHENEPAPPGISGKAYLRVANKGSALCTICHSY